MIKIEMALVKCQIEESVMEQFEIERDPVTEVTPIVEEEKKAQPVGKFKNALNRISMTLKKMPSPKRGLSPQIEKKN